VNPLRNETSLVLVVAVILSAVAIPVFSGFLEPSQPPAVAAVQIADPRDGPGDAPGDDGASTGRTKSDPQPEPETRGPGPAGDVQAERRRSAPSEADPAQSAPADDAAEDDGGEAD
jgi:hypothetical protein